MGDLTRPEARVPENQEAITRAVERVIEHLRQEYPTRVPRSEEACRNRFAAWLEQERAPLQPVMRAAVAAEGLVEDAGAPDAAQTAEQYVWPEVAEFLLGFAIRVSASRWGSHQYYDATTMSWPERQGDLWRIRLGVHGYEGEFGQVMLDADGNVLTDLTTTRDEIHEALSGRSRSPAATASRE